MAREALRMYRWELGRLLKGGDRVLLLQRTGVGTALGPSSGREASPSPAVCESLHHVHYPLPPSVFKPTRVNLNDMTV